MRTPAVDLLGTEFPIVAFSHCRDVVAAVSRAGGLGVLGAADLSPEELDRELTWIDEQVAGRPYGVDLLIPVDYVGKEQRGRPWEELVHELPDDHRAFVDEVLERYGVPPLPDGVTPPLPALTESAAEPLLERAFRHPISLIANALGPPPPALLEEAQRRGIVVAGLAGKAAHARRQRDAGVDLIVAQGTEAGGHTGEIATMVLTPDVVEAVHPTPVLAAGGIASGAQVAAAMALGASGVWTGSVWLMADEAMTSPVVRERFVGASASDTIRSRAWTGKPARQLRSAWTDAWEDETAPPALPMPLQSLLIADARARIGRAADSGHAGGRELVNEFVGQVVGGMRGSRSVRAIMDELVGGYITTVERLAATLDD